MVVYLCKEAYLGAPDTIVPSATNTVRSTDAEVPADLSSTGLVTITDLPGSALGLCKPQDVTEHFLSWALRQLSPPRFIHGGTSEYRDCHNEIVRGAFGISCCLSY